MSFFCHLLMMFIASLHVFRSAAFCSMIVLNVLKLLRKPVPYILQLQVVLFNSIYMILLISIGLFPFRYQMYIHPFYQFDAIVAALIATKYSDPYTS